MEKILSSHSPSQNQNQQREFSGHIGSTLTAAGSAKSRGNIWDVSCLASLCVAILLRRLTCKRIAPDCYAGGRYAE